MDLAMFHSWWTVALVILFVAIIAWAWSGKRKKTFEQAARMPLEDEDAPSPAPDTRGRGQGKRVEPVITPARRRGKKHG